MGVALIVTLPPAIAVAIPCAPEALLIVATVVSVEAQVTLFVMTCVLESLNCPVARNGTWVPAAIEEIEGVMDIDTSVAVVTVRLTPVLAPPVTQSL